MRRQRMIRQAEHAQRVKSSHAFAALLPFSKLGENEGTNNINIKFGFVSLMVSIVFKHVVILIAVTIDYCCEITCGNRNK